MPATIKERIAITADAGTIRGYQNPQAPALRQQCNERNTDGQPDSATECGEKGSLHEELGKDIAVSGT